MKLKRFEALTLKGALQAVKDELGSDAVIVSTRRIQKGGGLFGLLSQTVVEVTAAVDRKKESKRYQIDQSDDVRITAKKNEAVKGTIEISPKPDNEANFQEQLRMATLLDPLTQQLTAVRDELKRLREDRENPETTVGPIRQEIEGLRVIVGEALGDRMRQRLGTLPGDLRGQYEQLLTAGVKPQLAHDLLRAVAETLGTSGLSNTQVVRELLWGKMEESISVSGSLLPSGGSRKVVLLVGPTGVGKTTTIAKLASLATRAERPYKTLLVTLDTYRIAAVEQLRVYARILKVPFEVAIAPDDLPNCIERHRDAELILIDTAGRSPQDRTGEEELAAIAKQNIKLETHLVLAAPTEGQVLHDVVRHYRTIPVHRLLFTKLDEAKNFGNLFDVLQYTGLPVSYLAMGQRVPEDLELATRRRVIELMGLPSPEQAIPLDTLVEAKA